MAVVEQLAKNCVELSVGPETVIFTSPVVPAGTVSGSSFRGDVDFVAPLLFPPASFVVESVPLWPPSSAGDLGGAGADVSGAASAGPDAGTAAAIIFSWLG